MKKLIAVVISACAFNAYAQEPSFYVGGNLSSMTFESDFGGEDIDVTNLEGIAGVDFLDYLGAEVRLGTGIKSWEDSVLFEGDSVSVEYKVNHYYSFYVKPKVELEKFGFYSLLGYTMLDSEVSTNFSVSGTDLSASTSDQTDGLSYGLGAYVDVAPNVSVNAEWKRVLDIDETDVNSLSLGATFKF